MLRILPTVERGGMETAGAYSGAECGEGETLPHGGLCVSAVLGGLSVERAAAGGRQAEGWSRRLTHSSRAAEGRRQGQQWGHSG